MSSQESIRLTDFDIEQLNTRDLIKDLGVLMQQTVDAYLRSN